MTEYFKKACIAIIIFAFSNTVYAQTDSIDVFVKAQMQKRRISGLQLAIVKNGKIIKTANYESIGKNFSEFINHYRVDAFKMFSNDPKNSHITLSGPSWYPCSNKIDSN